MVAVSRLFISHSSVDNAAELAVAEWLTESGWDDYFLDVSADRGLVPGQRWQEGQQDGFCGRERGRSQP